MHPLIYDVAVSLDGYISGPAGDISHFAQTGPVVDDYFARLGGYKTAIMGRRTYEFGYAHGLTPGENPYPHMQTYVFSHRLSCPAPRDITILRTTTEAAVREIKTRSDGPVYLCGGGAIAGWLLQRGLVDRLIVKRAPCVLGGGVPLFGDAGVAMPLTRVATQPYEGGYLLEEFVP